MSGVTLDAMQNSESPETDRRHRAIGWATDPSVVIVDHQGSGADRATLGAIAAALQRQVSRDFAPRYHTDIASCTAVLDGSIVPPDAWVIGLFSDPDQPGALGYHDQTPYGLPLAKVFPKLDAQDGSPLSVTISHELLEMLADPLLAKAVQSEDGKFWAYEVCDAVENDQYEIDGVMVSNFVTPQYFEPPPRLEGVMLDFMGLVQTPYQVRPGGYMQYYAGGGWRQVVHRDHARRPYREKMHGRGHRRQRRVPVVDG